ncbi:hypothetical protein ABZZ36_14795 [Actinacidiphila glaucinigra]|uniref:hypothetical protein n=1 Tax=Actinacidiphila glaucinigra TaxID=235986 RepID=UPI0033A94B45
MPRTAAPDPHGTTPVHDAALVNHAEEAGPTPRGDEDGALPRRGRVPEPPPAPRASSSFHVPEAARFREVFGVAPVPEEGFENVEVLELVIDEHDILCFSYDVILGSFMVRWLRDDDEILSIYREGARGIWIEDGVREKYIVVHFELGGHEGSLSIRVYPDVSVSDRLMDT